MTATRTSCAVCGRPHPDWALTDTDICGRCVIDARREAAAPTPPDPLASARAERNRRLAASDWTQLPDARLDAAARDAWAAYREAVRAVVDAVRAGSPAAWPTPPES